MKTIFIIFLSLFMSYSLIAQQEPKIKVYLNDGSFQSLNISEIENIGFIKGENSYLMKIFNNNSNVDYYPVVSFDNIKFEKNGNNTESMNVYVFGVPKNYEIKKIDSITFSLLEPKIINSDKLVVIDASKQAELVSIDNEKINFDKVSSTAKNLEIGDILVSEPSELAPNGFLKRVKSISSNSLSFEVETENANLTDIIENGVIYLKKHLNDNDLQGISLKKGMTVDKTLSGNGFNFGFNDVVIYDYDKNDKTVDDQVLISGSIRFNPEIYLLIVFEEFAVKQIIIQLTFEAEISCEPRLNIGIPTIQKTISLLPHPWYLVPLTIPVFGFPVVVTPSIDLCLRFEANASTGCSMEFADNFTLTAGVEFNNGKLKPIFNTLNTPSINFGQLFFGGTVRAILGPQLDANFYGQKSAFNGYIRTGAFFEAEVDAYDNPWLAVYGGVQANGGIESDWFKIFAEIPYTLEYKQKIFEIKNCHIDLIEPNSAKINDEIRISGTGFGNTKGVNFVMIGNRIVTNYLKWSDDEIILTVPEGSVTGKAIVYQLIGDYPKPSNEYDFAIIQPPQISYINPTSGKVGDAITISGSGFGSSRGSSYVTFNGTNATSYTSWNDNQISVNVPSGVTNGYVSVTVNETKSNGMNFTVVVLPTLQITSLSPTSGKVGDVINIYGNNFGTARGSSIVTFNSTNSTEYTNWSNSQISVKVPTGATSGKVYVTVDGTKSNEKDFTVNASQTVYIINPSKDAFIEAVDENENYNKQYLRLGYQAPYNQFYVALYFPMPSNISANNIESAYLYLTKQSGSGTLKEVVGLYINADWDESAINSYWANNNVSFSGFDKLNDITGDIVFPMKAAVTKWVNTPSSNHGILLYPQALLPRTVFTYYDRENGNNIQKPRLVITMK